MFVMVVEHSQKNLNYLEFVSSHISDFRTGQRYMTARGRGFVRPKFPAA